MFLLFDHRFSDKLLTFIANKYASDGAISAVISGLFPFGSLTGCVTLSLLLLLLVLLDAELSAILISFSKEERCEITEQYGRNQGNTFLQSTQSFRLRHTHKNIRRHVVLQQAEQYKEATRPYNHDNPRLGESLGESIIYKNEVGHVC